MRAALTCRDLQTVLRLYRECTGLTQEAIALLIDRDQGTVSKIANGRRSRFTIEEIESFRDGLHIPGHLLGLQSGEHEIAPAVMVETQGRERGDVPTRRREFNRTVLLTVLGATGTLGSALTEPEPPAHIGWEHVRMLEQAVERLMAQDALVGGDTLCDVATLLFERASGWLHNSSYPADVGDALRSAVGELGASVGWLAIDANRETKAREHFQETLLLARMGDDHPLEVHVLCTMSLLSLRQKRSREALYMAQTAQRITAGWGTPRLLTLLHLRAALAYAELGNPAAFNRELAKAKNKFEAGTHPDDPPFVNFVTVQELTGLTGRSYLHLGKPERASDLFRQITEDPDPAFRRNATLYTVGLGEARLRSGDITEAAQIGLESVPVVAALDSGRARRRLHELRNQAARHPNVPQARDFIEAHDSTFKKTRNG